MALSVNNNGWWGEGEIKFYLDGDTDPVLSEGKEIAGSTVFPTVCGTRTEDFFCGSCNFENKTTSRYQEYSTAYAGFPWHVTDPIRFREDLKVKIQDLGWRKEQRFLQLQDDIASVAYWYQTLPASRFPELPSADELEII